LFDEDYRGSVRFARSFGCPGGLDAGHRVELVVADVQCFARVAVNGHVVGEMASQQHSARFEITPLLEPRNVLHIDVDCPRWPMAETPAGQEGVPPGGGRLGEVFLEIVTLPEGISS
jgi:hypothetical protein